MDIILDPFDTSCMMLVSTEFSVSVASPRLFCISGSLCMSRMKWFDTKLSTTSTYNITSFELIKQSYLPWDWDDVCVNVLDGYGHGGGKDTMVSASVRVSEVTTIAAAADKPRPPDEEMSEEVGCSRESSSSDDRFSDGVNEPTAVQFSPGPAVAVLRSVSILCG